MHRPRLLPAIAARWSAGRPACPAVARPLGLHEFRRYRVVEWRRQQRRVRQPRPSRSRRLCTCRSDSGFSPACMRGREGSCLHCTQSDNRGAHLCRLAKGAAGLVIEVAVQRGSAGLAVCGPACCRRNGQDEDGAAQHIHTHTQDTTCVCWCGVGAPAEAQTQKKLLVVRRHLESFLGSGWEKDKQPLKNEG